MKVRYAAPAKQDLIEIQDHIAKDDQAAAWRLAQRIRAHVSRLAQHPNLGRPGQIHGTRELTISGTPYFRGLPDRAPDHRGAHRRAFPQAMAAMTSKLQHRLGLGSTAAPSGCWGRSGSASGAGTESHHPIKNPCKAGGVHGWTTRTKP
jgi:toxin ParE1/3/4